MTDNAKGYRMERVYCVIQHQDSEPEFDNRTVYVCKTRELAEYAAAKLNKQYAKGVTLDEDSLVSDIANMDEDKHYYDVESYAIEQTKEDIDEYEM